MGQEYGALDDVYANASAKCQWEFKCREKRGRRGHDGRTPVIYGGMNSDWFNPSHLFTTALLAPNGWIQIRS